MNEGPEIGKSWREKRNRGGERLQSEREAGRAEHELGRAAIKSRGEGRLEVIGRRETDDVRLLLTREDGPSRPTLGQESGNVAASAAGKLHYLRPQLCQSGHGKSFKGPCPRFYFYLTNCVCASKRFYGKKKVIIWSADVNEDMRV